jgi:hypothetical protein
MALVLSFPISLDASPSDAPPEYEELLHPETSAAVTLKRTPNTKTRNKALSP